MPILAREEDLYPCNLFESIEEDTDQENIWWALYTLSRREKDLMRQLCGLKVPFYCPIIPKQNRSPAGRMRTSYLPLFTNYVFVYGTDMDRYTAVTTGCVSRCLEVGDGAAFTHDMRQIHRLIQVGERLIPEKHYKAGELVRVKSGPFRNFEGTILRREGQTRLLVHVNFLQQGASVLLEDFEVERLNWKRRAS